MTAPHASGPPVRDTATSRKVRPPRSGLADAATRSDSFVAPRACCLACLQLVHCVASDTSPPSAFSPLLVAAVPCRDSTGTCSLSTRTAPRGADNLAPARCPTARARARPASVSTLSARSSSTLASRRARDGRIRSSSSAASARPAVAISPTSSVAPRSARREHLPRCARLSTPR